MEETHTAHTGEEDEEITQEDTWHVISAFFEEKGLVRQQLESFDDFLQYKMQDIVDEDPTIVLTPEAQHMPGQTAAQTQVSYAFTCAFVLQLQLRYEIQFNQVWLSKTNVSEPDSSVQELYPQEARLRNLTYVARIAPLFFFFEFIADCAIISYASGLYIDISKTTIQHNPSGAPIEDKEDYPRVPIGRVRASH